MKTIEFIRETKDVVDYLKKRNLILQYQRIKQGLLSGVIGGSKIGKLKPKEKDIWYFRINKQYRAIAIRDTPNSMRVFEIDDHAKM